MNAPHRFDNAIVQLSSTPTPKELQITPRDRRFGRAGTHVQAHWWLNDDLHATAIYNALSVTFPKGEAYFFESVKAHRVGVLPKLAAEICRFTMQEVMHSREHLAFSRRVVESGYDVSKLEARADEVPALTKGRPVIINMAANMALEILWAFYRNIGARASGKSQASCRCRQASR